ncbi:Hypothetical protein A7982_04224 [Minicystis rosea]|nr:Hypothetical protein A7982_04224 [Minicystis rosea]
MTFSATAAMSYDARSKDEESVLLSTYGAVDTWRCAAIWSRRRWLLRSVLRRSSPCPADRRA